MSRLSLLALSLVVTLFCLGCPESSSSMLLTVTAGEGVDLTGAQIVLIPFDNPDARVAYPVETKNIKVQAGKTAVVIVRAADAVAGPIDELLARTGFHWHPNSGDIFDPFDYVPHSDPFLVQLYQEHADAGLTLVYKSSSASTTFFNRTEITIKADED